MIKYREKNQGAFMFYIRIADIILDLVQPIFMVIMVLVLSKFINW